jgi:uncharacterized membrane protein YjgN (DUF898 family)
MSVGDPLAARETEPLIRRLYFHGTGGTLFGIHVVNILLTLITLGIYYFWAKVRVRAYLLGQTEFLSDRFAFHGTGKEILVGWLKAALVFGLPAVLLGVGPELVGAGPPVQVAAQLLLTMLVIVFIPVAVVGARRYRLSRTSWRGIRFSFRGRARDFVRLFLAGAFLSAITLGLYYPVFEARRHRFLVDHSCFGNRRFGFDGRGQDLFGLYLVATLVLVGVLGLYAVLFGIWVPLVTLRPELAALPALVGLGLVGGVWSWFSAKKQRYLWDHTTFEAARFHSTVTGRTLFGLRLGNLALLVLTLGLAWPWVTVRNARVALRYLTLEGPLDLETIQQEAQLPSATGEALAGFLDAGFDLG